MASFAAYYGFPNLSLDLGSTSFKSCPQYAKKIGVKEVWLAVDPKTCLNKTLHQLSLQFPQANRDQLSFLAGLQRGTSLVFEPSDSSVSSIWLVGGGSLSFFSGFLLAFSHWQIRAFLGWLSFVKSSKKQVERCIGRHLSFLRRVSSRPIEGLEMKKFDVFDYYVCKDPPRALLAKQLAFALAKFQGVRADQKLGWALFGLSDSARFFGKHHRYLLYFLKEGR